MKIKLINFRFLIRKRLHLMIMRILVFLLCTTVFSLAPNASFSQEKVMIEEKQSVSAEEVFSIIQQQTNYHFIFPKRLLKNAPSIMLEKGEMLVVDLLEKALQNSNLEFEVAQNNTIVINKANPQNKRRQQKVTVSGKVVDENGVSLLGVTIVEQGTTNGVATDFDGNYTIAVKNNAVLEFSFIGFKSQTLNVADLSFFSNVNITLKEDINALDEVVLTGYQTLSKERTAGSFAKADVQQIQQRPSSINIIDRLAGQVAGLNIVPGSEGATFEIRGRSTVFFGNDNPLIIVDGFPLTDQRNFNSINPEDVESITVLKDASASSIWGARASNGVVVVVTKTGNKNKKMTVDFSSFVEFENKVDLDDMNWMSTSDEIDLDLEAIEKGIIDPESLIFGNSSINDLHLAHIYRAGVSPDGNVWSQNTFDNFIAELRTRNINKEWEKYLLRSAVRKTYNLSLSGGGERNSFYASLAYTDKLEQSIGNKNDQFSVNIRNVFDFNDKLSFTTGITTVLRNQTLNSLDPNDPQRRFQLPDAYSNVLMAGFAQPYDRLIDDNGQYVQKYYNWNPWVSQEREAIVGSPHTYNYLQEQRNLDMGATLLDVRGYIKIDYELLEGLKLNGSFSYERNTNDIDQFRSMNLPSHRNMINDHYTFDSDLGAYRYQIPEGINYAQSRQYNKGWVGRLSATWDKTWQDHELTVFGGSEYNRRFTETIFNRQFGFDKQTVQYEPVEELSLVSYAIRDWNGGRQTDFSRRNMFSVTNADNRFVSYFSNMAYTYNKKYTINGSFRIDQANIWGSSPDHRYKPLWSVGGAWDIDKESFLENTNWINRLKLRATYGLGGNSVFNASPYPIARTRNISWGYSYNGLVLSQPGNPDLRWEETATTDFGLDFAFLDNRLTGSIDYYTKKSKDILSRRQVDPTTGFRSATVNYANIENKGYELVLNADIIRNQDFTWNVRANFNYNKNILTNFKSETTRNAYNWALGAGADEGKPFFRQHSFRYAGLNDNGEVLLFDRNNNEVLWSDYQTLEVEDLKYEGGQTPTYYGGLSSTLSYKGIDLTVNLNYQGGYVNRRSVNRAWAGLGSGNNNDNTFGNIRTHQHWANRWMQPGDELVIDVPKIFSAAEGKSTSFMHAIYNASTAHTFKGDYIRVQDIILGYTLPSQVMDRTFFKSLKFTMQVANPYLWVANDFDIDPTAPGDEAYLNLPRYIFGVRATF